MEEQHTDDCDEVLQQISKHKPIQTFCTSSESPIHYEYYVKSVPRLRGKYIAASFNGWLILRDSSDTKDEGALITLFNPLTFQTLQLPEAPGGFVVFSYALVSTPDLNDCVFFLLGSTTFYCRPAMSNPTWVKQKLEVDGKVVIVGKAAVLDNRTIYALAILLRNSGSCYAEEWTVVSMEVNFANDDGADLLVLKLQLQWPGYSLKNSCTADQSHLIESCGVIYCVQKVMQHDRLGVVKVWELDVKGRRWVDVKCLDGRAFFVMGEYCTWCWGSTTAGSSVSENCVYFRDSILAPDILQSYSLHDNNLALVRTCPNSRVISQERLLKEKARKQMIKKELLLDQDINPSSRKKRSLKIEAPESLFFQLPLHLVELVLNKLHLFEYMNFRATCKLFQSIAPVTGWKTNHKSLPLLTSFKGDEVCQIFDPCRSDLSLPIIFQPSKQVNYTIDFSKNGWLLILSHPTHSIQYFNPSTRERGDYPPNSNFETDVISIGFSTYPTSADCVTIAFVPYTDNIHYYRYGDDTWSSCGFDIEPNSFKLGKGSPVYHKGTFYLLARDGNLGALKLADGIVSWQTYKKPEIGEADSLYSSHLVECSGELYSVFFRNLGRWVEVFRFDILEKNWVSVKRLGNYCIFISHSSSFSAMTTEAGKGNRIYLPKFRGEGMVYYCLETQKYVVTGSDETIEDFLYSKEPLNYCWIDGFS